MLLIKSQRVLFTQPQDKILPDPSLKNSCNSLKKLICFIQGILRLFLSDRDSLFATGLWKSSELWPNHGKSVGHNNIHFNIVLL